MWTHGLQSFHSIQLRPKPPSECIEHLQINEIPNVDLNQNIFRTQLLLLDYKQFKAARLIQRNFRGWRVRHMMKERRRAAIQIQRMWRKYLTERNLIVNIQNRTQSNVLFTFDASSIKIQALFRGWWSRKYVNNMIYLKTIQLNAVEDILHCLSYKMHTMKRTEKIPGIRSFREDDCLHKVEDLVGTLTYRLYNRYVGTKWITSRAQMDKQRSNFKNSAFYTSVPYCGNDHINVCTPPPPPKELKTYERREYDVSQIFMAAKRIAQDHKVKQHPKSKARKKEERVTRCKQFCKDVIYSMRHWKIDDHLKLNIPDDIFEGKIQEFMTDLKGYLETLHYVENCNCLRDKNQSDPLAPDFKLQ